MHFPRFVPIPHCAALFLSPEVLKNERGQRLATALRGRAAVGVWNRSGQSDDGIPNDLSGLPRIPCDASDADIMRAVGLEGTSIGDTVAVVSDQEMDLVARREPEHRPRIIPLDQLPPELRRWVG